MRIKGRSGVVARVVSLATLVSGIAAGQEIDFDPMTDCGDTAGDPFLQAFLLGALCYGSWRVLRWYGKSLERESGWPRARYLWPSLMVALALVYWLGAAYELPTVAVLGFPAVPFAVPGLIAGDALGFGQQGVLAVAVFSVGLVAYGMARVAERFPAPQTTPTPLRIT